MASLPYPRRHQIIFPQKPTQPNHLWASVGICGRLFSARSFCVFREFRGRITMSVHECSVGAAETAAPPGRAAWVWQGCHTLLSVFRGRTRTPWGGKKNTKRAWRNAMPSYEFILWVHRLLGWCTWGQVHPPDKHPLKDYLTSTFLTLPSAVRTMFRPFWSLESLTPSTVKSCASPLAAWMPLIAVSEFSL